MVDLVCIRPFGSYNVGDDAGSVPDDAAYSTYYFAPADGSAPAQPAVSVHDQQVAELEAELAALEKENQ